MAKNVVHRHDVSIRLACDSLGISESCYHYEPKLSTENDLIADWLLRITTTHKRWGFGLRTKGEDKRGQIYFPGGQKGTDLFSCISKF
jgi:hypothetical protein